jgi:hypothetical protein
MDTGAAHDANPPLAVTCTCPALVPAKRSSAAYDPAGSPEPDREMTGVETVPDPKL